MFNKLTASGNSKLHPVSHMLFKLKIDLSEKIISLWKFTLLLRISSPTNKQIFTLKFSIKKGENVKVI